MERVHPSSQSVGLLEGNQTWRTGWHPPGFSTCWWTASAMMCHLLCGTEDLSLGPLSSLETTGSNATVVNMGFNMIWLWKLGNPDLIWWSEMVSLRFTSTASSLSLFCYRHLGDVKVLEKLPILGNSNANPPAAPWLAGQSPKKFTMILPVKTQVG